MHRGLKPNFAERTILVRVDHEETELLGGSSCLKRTFTMSEKGEKQTSAKPRKSRSVLIGFHGRRG